MKVTFAKGIQTFKPRKPRLQREEPLTPGQADRVQELLRSTQAKAQAKPTATTGTKLRKLVGPTAATVWRSSADGRIVKGDS